MTPEEAMQIAERVFRSAKLPNAPKEVSLGVFLCPVCDVFTDDPKKHRHGDYLE